MTLMTFAALAGAIQMIAPDRWMPISVFSWQRGWRFFQIAFLSLMAYTVHVALGFAVFLALSKLLALVSEDYLGIFTLFFLAAVGVIRILRFNRFREIFSRTDSRKVLLTLLSLLGPSEMVVPVLMKARLDGVAPVAALAPFLIGTWLVGLGAVLIARPALNKPLLLPKMFQWSQSRTAIIPMSIGALVGIVLISLRSMG